MTLLERALHRAGHRATVDEVLAYVALYGDAIRVITPSAVLSGAEALWTLQTAASEDDAIAILTAPVPGLGERVSGLVAIGVGARVNGKDFAARIRRIAQAWGAAAVMAATHRNPHAIVRKYGGTIESVNLRWET